MDVEAYCMRDIDPFCEQIEKKQQLQLLKEGLLLVHHPPSLFIRVC